MKAYLVPFPALDPELLDTNSLRNMSQQRLSVDKEAHYISTPLEIHNPSLFLSSAYQKLCDQAARFSDFWEALSLTLPAFRLACG
jgi:hypothetical protein